MSRVSAGRSLLQRAFGVSDGDGVVDAVDDPCADGLDNDGDGATDHPADPGCLDATWKTEAPQCQDGINNDPGSDALVGWDGGASAGVPPDLRTAPDPQCNAAWVDREAPPPGCGLGAELAWLLVPLARARRLRCPAH